MLRVLGGLFIWLTFAFLIVGYYFERCYVGWFSWWFVDCRLLMWVVLVDCLGWVRVAL